MGKTAKKILKVAAFVAIATFAAPVAAAIGLSAIVGTVAGAALVGAAAGAATNGILGGGIIKGAIMGGLGGAVGGLAKVAQTGTSIFGNAYPAASAGNAGSVIAGGAEAAGAVAPAVAEAAPLAAGEFAPIVVSHALGGGLSAGAAGLGTAVAGGLTGLAAGAPSVATTQPAQQTPTQQAQTDRFVDAYNSNGALPEPTSQITVTGTPTAPAGLISPEVATGGSALAGAATGLTAGNPAPKAADDRFLEEATGGPLGPQTTPVPGAPAAGGGLLSNVGGRLLDTAIAVAPPLLASVITGNQTAAATEAQQNAIEEQQQQYNNNFNLKTGYAQQLIDDADYYDPEGAGRRAAEAARIRAGLSARNAGRGMSRRRAEALRRQGEIEGGRDATRDYWSAYGATGAQRTNLRAAGINAIPLGSRPGTSDYESLYGRANDRTSDVAGLISSGIGAWTGRNTADRELEEIRRRGYV